MQLPGKGWLVSLAIAIAFVPLAFFVGRGCSTSSQAAGSNDAPSRSSATAPATSLTATSLSGPGLNTNSNMGDSNLSLATVADPSSHWDPASFLFSATRRPHPNADSSLSSAALDTATDSNIQPQRIDTFSVCSGARLPSGDSIYACFRAPQADFTFEEFISPARSTTPPASPSGPGGPDSNQPRPPGPLPLLDVHGYLPVEVNTSQILALGFGIETDIRQPKIDKLGRVTSEPFIRIAGECLTFPKPPFGLVKLRVEYYW